MKAKHPDPRFLFIVIAIISALGVSQAAETVIVDIENLFSPSGWMGDGEYGRKYVEFSGADSSEPHSPPSSIKISYRFGPKRWAGIYWLNRDDNWGDEPGEDYSTKGISRVTFWARGETGHEVVEFKSGGVSNKDKAYKDSYSATNGRVRLTKEWKQYEIDLAKLDLSSVIGGFCWVASQDYNSGQAVTFHLDDIAFK